MNIKKKRNRTTMMKYIYSNIQMQSKEERIAQESIIIIIIIMNQKKMEDEDLLFLHIKKLYNIKPY